MKAIRIHERGGPEVLIYENAPRPRLMPGDALVRVYASAITKDELTWDPTYQTANGEPRTPSIPGHEFSGVVEELAPDTEIAKVGEEVYGLASFYRDGSAAEFIAIHADDLAAKPKTLDHVHAAARTACGAHSLAGAFQPRDAHSRAARANSRRCGRGCKLCSANGELGGSDRDHDCSGR